MFGWEGIYLRCTDRKVDQVSPTYGFADPFYLQAVCSVLRNLLEKEDDICGLCFSHDGKYLATSARDKYIYVNASFPSSSCADGSFRFGK